MATWDWDQVQPGPRPPLCQLLLPSPSSRSAVHSQDTPCPRFDIFKGLKHLEQLLDSWELISEHGYAWHGHVYWINLHRYQLPLKPLMGLFLVA